MILLPAKSGPIAAAAIWGALATVFISGSATNPPMLLFIVLFFLVGFSIIGILAAGAFGFTNAASVTITRNEIQTRSVFLTAAARWQDIGAFDTESSDGGYYIAIRSTESTKVQLTIDNSYWGSHSRDRAEMVRMWLEKIHQAKPRERDSIISAAPDFLKQLNR